MDFLYKSKNSQTWFFDSEKILYIFSKNIKSYSRLIKEFKIKLSNISFLYEI
jgi:hypothetical protein